MVTIGTVMGWLGRKSKVCGTRWAAGKPGLPEAVTCRLYWASLSEFSRFSMMPLVLRRGVPE